MQVSLNWLNEFVDLSDIEAAQIAHELTMSGLEVEAVEEVKPQFTNIKTVKIEKIDNHPNSDHLHLVTVNTGTGVKTVVCGAQNIKEGQIVPYASVGSQVLDRKTGEMFTLTPAVIRGVESQGMLCSADELGVAERNYQEEDGILILNRIFPDVKIGENVEDVLGFDKDYVLDVAPTANRGDQMSVIGIARELSAIFNKPLKFSPLEFTKDLTTDELKVEIIDKDVCKYYSAGILKDLKIKPSPDWMQKRLISSGVRAINNVVDITNYVMLEYGQPMHAFDLRYVEGSHINVRNAKNGEKIMTLDGVERTLTEDMLVIADEKKPVAVAGVMGGEYSGIMDDTTTVVFESAYFEPTQVRRTSKALKLKSDASARYEKGVDPLISMTCLKRAFELVELLGAGEVLNTVIDCDHTDHKPSEVEFSPEWINNFLGTDISEADMKEYLGRLDFTFEGGKVVAPSFRIDIECKADIAEEVARIYGYNNIPSTDFRGVARAEFTEEQKFIRTLRNAAVALGGYEIATYSFVSPKYFDKIKLPQDSKLRNAIKIVNPLGEDTSVMRTSIIPSVLDVLSFNYNNRNEKACLFEISKEYLPASEEKPFINGNILANSGKEKHRYSYSLPDEPQRLTVGMYGGEADFYALKGMIEQLLGEMKIDGYEYIRAVDSDAFDEKFAFHPGRSAVIMRDGKALGILGEIHPEVQETYGIGVKTYVAKLNIPELMESAAGKITYQPLPKFPATTRDLSVICDDEIPVAELEKAIKGAVGKILEKVTLFDVYKGKQIEDGKKSVSYSISMRSHDGTLTDEQADGAMKRVLKALSAIGAELRS